MNLDENEMQEDIIEARRVMLKESGAIELAANRLNGNSFTKALNFLMETAHKVVVTGIGKSGHVGKKDHHRQSQYFRYLNRKAINFSA